LLRGEIDNESDLRFGAVRDPDQLLLWWNRTRLSRGTANTDLDRYFVGACGEVLDNKLTTGVNDNAGTVTLAFAFAIDVNSRIGE
jgi:hypothetical protein